MGTNTWTQGGKTYDSFVDGGKESPYVKWGGNPPAHPTKPYYLTAAEHSSQVSFAGDTGTIRVYDRPAAVAVHEEANFETAIVAVNHQGTGKDAVLKAFDWGWTSRGTSPTVAKGTKIAGVDSGVKVKSSASSRFMSIVAHDYSRYVLTNGSLSRPAKTAIGVLGGAAIGAGVGALAGGPVGALVGAGVGALVGGIGSLFF